MMYEKGSVFRLKYSGVINAEKMLRVCDMGIGIRKNEGFGRVIFIKDYEKIKYKMSKKYEFKCEKESNGPTPEDIKTLERVAKIYYFNSFL